MFSLEAEADWSQNILWRPGSEAVTARTLGGEVMVTRVPGAGTDRTQGNGVMVTGGTGAEDSVFRRPDIDIRRLTCKQGSTWGLVC